jgi:hypothetical protein
MADPGWGLHGVGEIFPFKPKGYVDKADQNRDLQERSDNSGKGLAGVDSEDGYSNSNR